MDTIRRILALALLSFSFLVAGQETTGFDPSTHAALGGDLDGDGRTDLVLRPLSIPDVPFIHFSADQSGERRDNLLLADILPEVSWNAGTTQLAIGDVDASGVDDLVLLSNDTLYVLTFKVRNNGNLKIKVKQEQPWADLRLDGTPADFRLVLHDMNGDGHDDLVLDPLASVRDLQIVLAKENGKFRKPNRYEVRLRMDEGDTIHYGDFNGDLATDVLLQRPDRNKLKIFLSDGGSHDGVNVPDRALGFDLDVATAVIGVAQWTGDGLADLIIQQRVDPADPSDAFDIQHRALKNRGRTTNNGAPKFSECALPGIGYGPNRGGLPECYEVDGVASAQTSAKGVPAQCTSCDSGYSLSATPNPCEDGYKGAKKCASQVDVIGPRSTSYCLFAESKNLLCSTHQASLLLGDIPAGGLTLSIHSSNDISSQQHGSLHIAHPTDLAQPPVDIVFTDADFGKFSPPRTAQPTVELCWKDYNASGTAQSVWRAVPVPSGWESVELSAMTTTALARGTGFRHCVSDDPRSGAFGDEGFTTSYRIEICQTATSNPGSANLYCAENEEPYPEIHFYPVGQEIQNVQLQNVSDTQRVPPIDVDGEFDLTWTLPEYLQQGDRVETVLNGIGSIATSTTASFDIGLADERQSIQVGVRVCTEAACLAESEVMRTVEIQEAAVPGQVSTINLSGMSASDPLVDDDGEFSVSWAVPDGTVDVYHWRLQEVNEDSTVTTLDSSNFGTTTNLSFSGYQTNEDRSFRFRVRGANLQGNGPWSEYDFLISKPNAEPEFTDLDEAGVLRPWLSRTDEVISRSVEVSDADNDDLEFTVSFDGFAAGELPPGIAFDTGTGTFSGQFQNTQPVTYIITVVVSDGDSVAEALLNWRVDNALGAGLKPVRNLSMDWVSAADRTFMLSWEYSAGDFGSVTGRPDRFIVEAYLPSPDTDGTVYEVAVSTFVNTWSTGTITDDSHFGSSYRVRACQDSGDDSRICGPAVTYSLPGSSSSTGSLPTPTVVLSNSPAAKSSGANTTLQLDIQNGNSPNTDYYRVEETGPLGTRIYFTTDAKTTLGRGMPGEYQVKVQACDRDRIAGDQCGSAAGSTTVTVASWAQMLAPTSIGALRIPGQSDYWRVYWRYPDDAARNLVSRPDYYHVVATPAHGAPQTWQIPVHNTTTTGLKLRWQDVHRKTFEVKACKWTGECADESISRYFNLNNLNPANEPPDESTNAAFQPITGGPNDLRPGEWLDPDRAGTGWAFFWANNLRYVRPDGVTTTPEGVTHEEYGEAYDLIAYWFGYRKTDVDGEIQWTPAWYFSTLVFDEDCSIPGPPPVPVDGDGCYSGSLYAPRDPSISPDAPGGLPRDAEGNPLQPIVGTLEVYLTLNSGRAVVAVDISDSDFALEQEFGGSFSASLQYFGNSTVGSFQLTNDADHLSGAYWDKSNPLTDFSLVNWIEGPHESVLLAYYDDLGRSTWARGDQTYCDREPDGGFGNNCDPNEDWSTSQWFRMHKVAMGFNPVETTPCELYGLVTGEDGFCEESCEIIDNENVCTEPGFLPDGFYPAIGNLTRTYPGEPGRSMVLDVNVDGLYKSDFYLDKQANFHDIRFFIDGDQGPDTCVLGTGNLDTCHVSLQWFSDGYHPNMIASRCAYSNDSGDPLISGCVDIEPAFGIPTWPNAVDVPFSTDEEGEYVFRLRRSAEPDAPIIAQSKPLTIVRNVLPLPKVAVGEEYWTEHERAFHDDYLGISVGEPGVSGGAATYSIPIFVPPGRRGMQPSLAVQYSSRGGSSTIGLGWSLSGLSSVSRCARTVAHDGRNGAVVFDRSVDRLCLDGQRLLLTSGGVYGAEDTTYATELDTTVRVTLRGGHMDDQDSWFTVERPDNTTAVYGNTSGVDDATFIPPMADGSPQSVPLSWAVAYEHDVVGNAIVYEYDMSIPSEQVIENVLYTAKLDSTGQAQLDADARIVAFDYEHYVTSFDQSVAFIGGRKTTRSRLLRTIESSAEEGHVRSYFFDHEPFAASARNKLLKVQLCGTADAGFSCQRVSFRYNNRQIQHTLTEASAAAITGDAQLGQPLLQEVQVEGAWTIDCTNNVMEDEPCLDNDAQSILNIAPVGDFDGDGTRELVYTVNAGTAAAPEFERYLVFSGITEDQIPYVRKSILLPDLLGGDFREILSQIPRYYDVNADGRVDFVGEHEGTLAFATYVGDVQGSVSNCVLSAQGKCQFRRIGTDVPFDSSQWRPVPGIGANYPDYQLADLNSDGFLDVVTRTQGASGGPWSLNFYFGKHHGGDLTAIQSLSYDRSSVVNLPLDEESIDLPYDLTSVVVERMLSLNDWDGDSDPEILLGSPYFGGGISGIAPSRLIELSGFSKTGATWDFSATSYGLDGELAAGEMDGLAALGIEKPLYESLYAFSDLNGDGRDDYLFVPAELNGQTFRPLGNPSSRQGCGDCRSWHVQLNTGASLADPNHPVFAAPQNLHVYEGLQRYTVSPSGGSTGYEAESWRPRLAGSLSWVDYDNDGRAEYVFPDELVIEGGYFLRADFSGEPPAGPIYAVNPHDTVEYVANPIGRKLYHYPNLSRFDPSIYRYAVRKVHWTGEGFETAPYYEGSEQSGDVIRNTSILGSRALSAVGDITSDGMMDFASPVGCYATWACSQNEMESIQLPDTGARQVWVSIGRTQEVDAERRVPQETLELTQDRHGNVYSWSYQPISVGDSVASAGGLPFYRVPSAGDRYINNDEFYFTSSMYAVERFRRTEQEHGEYQFLSANGPWTETRYAYGEAVFNKNGRGFQGFRSVFTESVDSDTQTKPWLNTFTASFFHQRFPLAGQIERTYSQRSDMPITGDFVFPTGMLSRAEHNYHCVRDDDSLVGCFAPQARNAHGVVRPFRSSTVQRMMDIRPDNAQNTYRYSLLHTTASQDRYGNTHSTTSTRTDFDFPNVEVVKQSTSSTAGYSPEISEAAWWPRKRLWTSNIAAVDYAEEPPAVATDFTNVETPLQTVQQFAWNDLRLPVCVRNIAVTVGETISDSELDASPLTQCELSSVVDPRIEHESVTESRYDCVAGPTEDCFGNPLEVITQGSAPENPEVDVSPPIRQRTMAYSDDGYFVETTTVEAGASDLTQTVYTDERFGVPELTRSSEGLWTRHYFDDFGRVIDTIYPIANTRAEALNVGIDDTASQYAPRQSIRFAVTCINDAVDTTTANYCIERITDGSPRQWSAHDSSGRVLRTVTEGFSAGTQYVSESAYNARGEVVAQTQPYTRSGSAPGPHAISVYEYDFRGRMIYKEDQRQEIDLDLSDDPPSSQDRILYTRYTYTGLKTGVLVESELNTGSNQFNPGPHPYVDGRRVPEWFYVERRHTANGWLLDTHDAHGERTRFWQDGQGNARIIADPDNNVTAANYDASGNRTALWDPNMVSGGEHADKRFAYNGLGEIAFQEDGRGTRIAHHYDPAGRRIRSMARRTDSPGADSWLVDQWIFLPGTGLLDKEQRFEGNGTFVLNPGIPAESQPGMALRFERSAIYDSTSLRPEGSVQKISVAPDYALREFRSAVETHDYLGRPKWTDLPEQVGQDAAQSPRIVHRYNFRGYLTTDIESASFDDSSTKVLRRITDMTPTGQVRSQRFGNGMVEQYDFHPQTWQMKSARVTKHGVDPSSGDTFQSRWSNIEYGYDYFGNLATQRTTLITRGDLTLESREDFTYDVLHRMTRSQRYVERQNAPRTVNVEYDYDRLGNILRKSDTALNLQYGTTADSGPNAVSEGSVRRGSALKQVQYAYDANGNREAILSLAGTPLQAVAYDAYDKAVEIDDSNADLVQFAYGSDQQRYWQGGAEPTIYVGKSYEAKLSPVTAAPMKHSFYLGDYAVWTVDSEADNYGVRGSLRYLHRDRLGSVIAASTSNGTVIPSSMRGFDAFGKPREDDWQDSQDGLNRKDITTRGFTDHEHLNDVELIHMNGRVFDYNLGRFLSIDPFIQFPENSQSLNPYSYILNNPMSGTDPSGYAAEPELPCPDHVDECVRSGSKYPGAPPPPDNGKSQFEFNKFQAGLRQTANRAQLLQVMPISDLGNANHSFGPTPCQSGACHDGGFSVPELTPEFLEYSDGFYQDLTEDYFLFPISGPYQLVTGEYMISGNEGSRFWGAVGTIPYIGFPLKSVRQVARAGALGGRAGHQGTALQNIIGQIQYRISVQTVRQAAVVDRWLAYSGHKLAVAYRTSHVGFAALIRGRLIDRRMNRWFKEEFGDVPGVRIDQTIPGSGSLCRPDLYFCDLDGASVIFDIGGASKMDDILKYQDLAEFAFPVLTN